MNMITKILEMLPPTRFFAVSGFMFAFDAFIYGRYNAYKLEMLDMKYDTKNKKRKHDGDALRDVVKRTISGS